MRTVYFQRSFYVTAVAVMFTFTLACSGDGESNPTSPTSPSAPATPTVTSLTITGLDAIRSGFFTTYTAQATLSNGTTATATASWSTDNSGVATVATNGDVTGVANGTATVIANYQGQSASKVIRIVSNFGGTWTGTYRIVKCDQAANFAGWCAGIGGVGAILPVALNLSQSGNSRDQITGTVSLGSITGNTSGNVTGDGRLILGGTFTNSISGTVFVVTIGGWDTRLAGSNGMAGGWAQSISANGFAGNAYQENQLVSMTQTSRGNSTMVREGGGETNAVQPVSGNYAMPLSQFFASMRQR